MKQVLIILRGAPASGKSTIAKKLRDYDKKIAWLKVDNFKPFFAEETDIIVDEVNKAAINSLEYLLNEGFSVIMEGIFQNPGYVDLAVNIADRKNIHSVVYQLFCPLDILENRDKYRNGIREGCRRQLGHEIIEKLFKVIEKNPLKKSEILETEKKSLNECLEIIRKNFKD